MTAGAVSPGVDPEPPSVPAGTTRDERLSRLLAEVHALAAAHGHPELTAALPRQVKIADATARVVVAGETKRGKSTLVNALLGRPGVSPVGPDVTTSCALTFTAGRPEMAHVLLAEPRETADGPCVDVHRREVQLADVADWATADGQQQQHAGGAETAGEVVGIDVRLDSPLLDRLALIDTPGLSGLRRSHATTTLARIAEADALLFVIDASQPVLAPEVDLLASAIDRVGTVLVVVAKSDAQSAERVDQLVAESRASLQRRDPRLGALDLLPVSARRAELAAQLEPRRPDDAARLRELSGLPALGDWLTGTVRGRATALRRRAAVRGAGAVLGALRSREDATPEAIVENAALRAALTAEQKRLQTLVSDRSRSGLTADVAQHLRRLQSEPQAVFDERVRQLREDYRERAVSGSVASLDSLPHDLQQDVAAAALEAGETLQALVMSLGTVVAERLGHTAAAAAVAERAAGDLALPLNAPGSPVGTPGATAFNMIGMLGLGGFAGNTAVQTWGALSGAALTGVTALMPVLALLPAAAGIGWWRGQLGERSQRRQHLAQWVAQTCQESRTLFATEVRRRLNAVQQYTDETLPQLIADRIAELQSVAAQSRALAESGQKARQQATARHTHRSAQIARLQRGADALLQDLLIDDCADEAKRKGSTVS